MILFELYHLKQIIYYYLHLLFLLFAVNHPTLITTEDVLFLLTTYVILYTLSSLNFLNVLFSVVSILHIIHIIYV